MPGTVYPAGIDSFPNPQATDTLDSSNPDLDHSQQHTNANMAVIAVESELGINVSGAFATADARFSNIEGRVGTSRVTAGNSPPSSPQEGDVWIDTTGL